MAQTYKFGNGTWATKKGSTLAYNDEDNNFKPLPFSFERNSIGTRVNKEGLIEVVGNDIPRIDYTDSTEGVLLLENSSTNLITYSEDFSHSSWVKNGTLIIPNTTIAPDGGLTAYTLTFSGSNQYLLKTANYTSTVGSKATISLFTKTEIQILSFGGATPNGTDVYGFESYANGWYRQELTRTFSVAATGTIQYILFGLAIGDYIIWGAQVEESYASSYIPTNGSTVQRAAETCNDSGNSEVFNDSQGVLFANISALDNDGTYRYLSLSDGSNNNNVRIFLTPTANQINFEATSANVVQAAFTYNGLNVLLNNKVVIKYKNNDFGFWVNGFEVSTDTSGVTPIGLDRFNFDRGTGDTHFYNSTKEIGYYDEILTDLELETLTSYRSLNEMVTELNLNAL